MIFCTAAETMSCVLYVKRAVQIHLFVPYFSCFICYNFIKCINYTY